jgi:hypothetical protein
MTKTYLIHAWCLRPFITCIDVEAETPEQAITKARKEHDKLLDAAEECTLGYPWDEFAAYDESGNEMLYESAEDPDIREAAPSLKEVLARLATAAEDLDVALDGITDQFDLERTELQVACLDARKVLIQATTRKTDRRPA